MKHPSLSELALYAGADCTTLQRWRVKRHLRQCSACRQEVGVNQAALQSLRETAAQMPPGIDWERLAEEMTGNIRVGLAAGECVGDFRPRHRLPLLRWNVATSMAMLVVLSAAAFFIKQPPAQSEHLVDWLVHIIGLDHSRSFPDTIAGAPAFGVLEAGPQQIAMHANGSTLSIVPDSASNVRVSVSLQGSAAARVVDADTGQVTISRVYDVQ